MLTTDGGGAVRIGQVLQPGAFGWRIHDAVAGIQAHHDGQIIRGTSSISVKVATMTRSPGSIKCAVAP
jgi:hypothetical protein